jgi:uncharacterized membrane protein
MILMAGLVKLPLTAVATIGIVIIAAHNLLDSYVGTLIPTLGNDLRSALWKILYVGFYAGPVQIGEHGPTLNVLYSIVPWIGVMASGYAFGRILTMERDVRNRLCVSIGIGAITLFLILRGFNLYGDPRPWSAVADAANGAPPMPAPLAFLNTTKYPASLVFLLMTLGPAIALLPFLEEARGAVMRWLAVFGRVPLFFYMLHIPLIHAFALAVSKVRLGVVSPWLFTNHPMDHPPPPPGYMWSLSLLYAVWALTIVVLYFACRWFAEARRSSDVRA